MSFTTRITTAGSAKIAAAMASGTPMHLTHLAVGDGSGAPTAHTPLDTALTREVHRAAVTAVGVSPTNPAHTVATLNIPAGIGGWTIREAALFDADGTLVAIADTPATEKPAAGSGVESECVLTMTLAVGSSLVALTVDSSAFASQAYVNAAVSGETGRAQGAESALLARIVYLEANAYDNAVRAPFANLAAFLVGGAGIAVQPGDAIALDDASIYALRRDGNRAVSADWLQVRPPSGTYAAAAHTHAAADIAQDGTHRFITDAERSAWSANGPAIAAETTRAQNAESVLTTALNGKAALVHNHAIADVTGLQTALNGKAASAHTHAAAEVVQDATHRFVTDSEKASWNSKLTVRTQTGVIPGADTYADVVFPGTDAVEVIAENNSIGTMCDFSCTRVSGSTWRVISFSMVHLDANPLVKAYRLIALG